MKKIALLIGLFFVFRVNAVPETWYLNVDVGYSLSDYPAEFNQDIARIKQSPGARNAPVALNLGFYFPLKNQITAVGLNLRAVNDSYTDGVGKTSLLQAGGFASAFHYFSEEIGDGFFVRADAGIFHSSNARSLGLAGLGAMGYGLPMNDEMRLTFQAFYGLSRVAQSSWSTASVSAGLLF